MKVGVSLLVAVKPALSSYTTVVVYFAIRASVMLSLAML